jgi:hypothetical protein
MTARGGGCDKRRTYWALASLKVAVTQECGYVNLGLDAGPRSRDSETRNSRPNQVTMECALAGG